MSPTGIHINKPLIGTVVGVFILVIVGYKYSAELKGTVYRSDVASEVKKMSQSEPKTWKTSEFKSLPVEAKQDLDKVTVKEADLPIKLDGKDVVVHYRQAEPDVCSLDVLFLHGAKFSSQTWYDKPMQSLQILSKLGYNAVAIDLPGYGKSKAATVDQAPFLDAVIKELKLKKPVIISPSMSGSYSLPFLFKYPEGLRGYVPVAPGGTSNYKKEDYEAIKVPTMIIYGEKDRSMGEKSKQDLSQLPNSEVFMYKDASHPAYLDRPDDFHRDLHNFFLMLLSGET